MAQVALRILKKGGILQYNRGEVAGFDPEVAQALVNRGEAEYFDARDRIEGDGLDSLGLADLRARAILMTSPEYIEKMLQAPAFTKRGGDTHLRKALIDVIRNPPPRPE